MMANDSRWMANASVIQSNPIRIRIQNPESESNPCVCDARGRIGALMLRLKDGKEYPVGREYVQQMQALYPAVDVMRELRTMKA